MREARTAVIFGASASGYSAVVNPGAITVFKGRNDTRVGLLRRLFGARIPLGGPASSCPESAASA